ncbi:MAG: HDIG domain-containing protein [Candidatus Cloacimonadota bacterium]|nr:MAG: HDIG domain-containing protein [Candidatus Cloacimonadota bacterium]
MKRKSNFRLILRRLINRRIAIFIRVVIILILLNILFPKPGKVFTPLRKGDIAPEDIVAPFTFEVKKDPEVIKKERRRAIEDVLPVLDYDEEKTQEEFGKIDGFFMVLYESEEKAFDKKLKILVDSGYPILKNTVVYLSRSDIRKKSEKIKEILFIPLEHGIIYKKNDIPFMKEKRVMVRRANGENIYALKDFYSLGEAKEFVKKNAYSNIKSDEAFVKAIDDLANLFYSPNLRVNVEETEKRRREASGSVAETKGLVLKGEMIVRAHDQITREIELKLNSLNIIDGDEKNIVDDLLFRVGLNILLVLLLFFFYYYIYKFKNILWRESEKLLIFEVVLIIFAYVSSLLFNLESVYLFLIPVSFIAITSTMLFGGSFGMIFSFILASTIAIFVGMRFPIFIFLMLSGISGIYSVRGLKRRAQLYKTFLILSASNVFLMFGIESFSQASMSTILMGTTFGFINAVASVSLVTVLLPLFERVTETTSNITLFEWSDLNRRLLKKLSVSAPGTYNHSIIVGSLAEAAAEAIGANLTLARVASYYHDIGKMEKPGYFIENQMGIKNPHTKLTPQLSCIILVSHVKEGFDIARKAYLPNDMVKIIREHHGTSLIVPFYEKAKKRNSDEKIDESQFRYPGPLPTSKESGIVMIADSVEAASRSLEEPNAKKLRSLINEIIKERFQDGQLNDSQLTLVDLKKIGESFLPILVGMHHLRIEYP